jgi:hypothetical protein
VVETEQLPKIEVDLSRNTRTGLLPQILAERSQSVYWANDFQQPPQVQVGKYNVFTDVPSSLGRYLSRYTRQARTALTWQAVDCGDPDRGGHKAARRVAVIRRVNGFPLRLQASHLSGSQLPTAPFPFL